MTPTEPKYFIQMILIKRSSRRLGMDSMLGRERVDRAMGSAEIIVQWFGCPEYALNLHMTEEEERLRKLQF